MVETYKKYRPATFNQVIGQQVAVSTLRGFLAKKSLPQAILFHGPSGTGKTTLARILANEVGAAAMSIEEMNFASDRGIETVRKLEEAVRIRPMAGNSKVFICDEAHQMTPQAAQSMLKLLEDTPEGCYFMLCTSEPAKIPRALATRLTKIEVEALTDEELMDLLNGIPDYALSKKTEQKIIKAAQGSAREALVMYDHILAAGDTPDVVDVITRSQEESGNLFEIAKILLGGTTKDWAKLFDLVDGMPDDQIEGCRWMVLNYAKSCMKNPAKIKRAARVVQGFRAPFFETKKAGFIYASAYALEMLCV
jgi:DNA polymerase III gamma/tau subunit